MPHGTRRLRDVHVEVDELEPGVGDERVRGFFRELLDIGIAHREAERRRPRHALAAQRRDRVTGEQRVLVEARRARQRRRVGDGRSRDRVDVARRVSHRAAHRAGHGHERVVERARVTDAPERDLEPEQAGVRRGDADGAAAVAARADRHHPRGHGRRRTARRATGRALGMPRVARHAVQVRTGPVRRAELG